MVSGDRKGILCKKLRGEFYKPNSVVTDKRFAFKMKIVVKFEYLSLSLSLLALGSIGMEEWKTTSF